MAYVPALPAEPHDIIDNQTSKQEIRILVATDVMSEALNLQDGDYVFELLCLHLLLPILCGTWKRAGFPLYPVRGFAVFYNPDGEPLDSLPFDHEGIIPAHSAKRIAGELAQRNRCGQLSVGRVHEQHFHHLRNRLSEFERRKHVQFPRDWVKCAHDYYYRVRAFNGCATSSNSSVKSVQTSP